MIFSDFFSLPDNQFFNNSTSLSFEIRESDLSLRRRDGTKDRDVLGKKKRV